MNLPGGYSWEFVVGVCHPVLQILAPFPDQKVVFFHTRFQTWPLKSIPVLIPGLSRNYVIITEIRTPAKRILKIYLDFAYYSFFLIHQFGIETTNTFMHFLENHT